MHTKFFFKKAAYSDSHCFFYVCRNFMISHHLCFFKDACVFLFQVLSPEQIIKTIKH